MDESAYNVRALDESTWAAFAGLVERNNGVFGGCWCMGFHPEGVGKETTAALNRERKLERVRTGAAHAALVFEGDDCLGWCQFGPPDEVPRIKSRAAYENGRTVSPDWRIACCYVGKGYRRQGVATAALAGAVDLIAALGGIVEGYPEDAARCPRVSQRCSVDLREAGFVRPKIGKHRWVATRGQPARSEDYGEVRAMDLVCYLVDDHQVDIRPARNRREWMNQTPGSYAYRCLPLSIANAHGWEVRCPVAFEAEWTGGSDTGDIHVTFDDDDNSSARSASFVESHFGSGILTFNIRAVIQTPPAYDLWVTGPVNDFKDGIQAMSAVIETYWMPFTFTMNWKFTRPQVKVRFEKGEPFCFFFPVEPGSWNSSAPPTNRSANLVLEKQLKFAGTGWAHPRAQESGET